MPFSPISPLPLHDALPIFTSVFGATTESGTWSAGLGHIGVWNDGKIRYVGAGGYASLNLDWFGKGDSLGGESIADRKSTRLNSSHLVISYAVFSLKKKKKK